MNSIYRVFIEKRAGFDIEASNLFSDIEEFLNIKTVKKVRILYRYDVQNITEEEFQQSVTTIFSDPPQDISYVEKFQKDQNDSVICIEYLPGQYDQRSDSASQCIEILTHKKAPLVRTAKILVLSGNISKNDLSKIKKYCINPVDSHEASLDKPDSLEQKVVLPKPVKSISPFITASDNQLKEIIKTYALAMSFDDIKFCQSYFKNDEKRNPTITEIKMLDTYWSDHCRHTTFLTEIEDVKIEKSKYSDCIEETYKKYLAAREFVYNDKNRQDCLMDLATIAMKELRKRGKLKELDISDEINACSIRIPVEHDGIKEDWLIMFKNETHNHPTEIEPFGGAATCLGGAIRDPLSGRAYVYQAMRVSGSGDPRQALNDTLEGKLPQRTITTKAAKGYSSYGNQIGLSTGHVTEIYDEGYIAKRMEIGAVVGAVPAENVRREQPLSGDFVILVGGRTGRDGIGGATGSSKAHTETALKNEAEVQKGNPPIERKLQRFFSKKEVAIKIKRCNDFGAGGVSVAIGELAESIDIKLDSIPKKYDGLDGTELALSESQERMALVINPKNFDYIRKQAFAENLEATKVAEITNSGRLRMYWQNQKIVDIARSFIETNGVRQKTKVTISAISDKNPVIQSKTDDLRRKWLDNLQDLNAASQKGLIEQFDSTIGARTVLHPFGGKSLLSPSICMVSKLPFIESDIATAMSWGFDPRIAKWSPFHSAAYAVVDSVAKLVAVGADYQNVYLTFQEYFEKLGNDESKWGKPFSALLGAYRAQSALGVAAIGGKDSMSGTFNDVNVPPTLVSFAISPLKASLTVSNEFKGKDHSVILIRCPYDVNQLPDFKVLKDNFLLIHNLIKNNQIFSSRTIGPGGLAAAITKMTFGNSIGFKFSDDLDFSTFFEQEYGSIILEIEKDIYDELKSNPNIVLLGRTIEPEKIIFNDTEIKLHEAISDWEKPLEDVFPTFHGGNSVEKINFDNKKPRFSVNRGIMPNVFIPVFPGTNCEYDSEQAFKKAGAKVDTLIFNNLTQNALTESIQLFADQIDKSQILMLPGGFSAGDEPEGSGKFIATVFRNGIISEAVMNLLARDGLILGICNGFQALIKLGLLPFGEIREADPVNSPTLTFNKLKRHFSCMVRTKIVSTLSPWLQLNEINQSHTIPISNGEGRFVATTEMIEMLINNGQIATQYIDNKGLPSMLSKYNPSGSLYAIEGITNHDGRIFGKMAHSERIGINVSKNIPGDMDQKLFEAGVKYFK